MKQWIRTCQECGSKQVEATPPVYGMEPSDSYLNRKCKECGSEALDYGSEAKNKNKEQIGDIDA